MSKSLNIYHIDSDEKPLMPTFTGKSHTLCPSSPLYPALAFFTFECFITSSFHWTVSSTVTRHLSLYDQMTISSLIIVRTMFRKIRFFYKHLPFIWLVHDGNHMLLLFGLLFGLFPSFLHKLIRSGLRLVLYSFFSIALACLLALAKYWRVSTECVPWILPCYTLLLC